MSEQIKITVLLRNKGSRDKAGINTSLAMDMPGMSGGRLVDADPGFSGLPKGANNTWLRGKYLLKGRWIPADEPGVFRVFSAVKLQEVGDAGYDNIPAQDMGPYASDGNDMDAILAKRVASGQSLATAIPTWLAKRQDEEREAARAEKVSANRERSDEAWAKMREDLAELQAVVQELARAAVDA